MSKYECPHCHGGFDEPDTTDGQALACCPWCGTKLNRGYDPERFERVVSRVARGDSDDSGGILPRLFK